MVAAGDTEIVTHNAIGKIYVTLNKHSARFLINNQFYDPKVKGKKNPRGSCSSVLHSMVGDGDT